MQLIPINLKGLALLYVLYIIHVRFHIHRTVEKTNRGEGSGGEVAGGMNLPQGSAIFPAWSIGFVGMGQINPRLETKIT